MTLRFGLVGTGRWGAVHAAVIAALPGAELAAVAVSSEASARRVEAELGVPGFAGWRTMLERAELDAVDVVALNAMHAEVTLAALEAGLHVLVEKPLATTLADCDAVVEAARRSGRVVAVGHELRYSPLWVWGRRIGPGRFRRLGDIMPGPCSTSSPSCSLCSALRSETGPASSPRTWSSATSSPS